MRFIIIITIFFLVSLSIQPVFSQSGSRNIMVEYCQKNWENDPDGCSDYIVDGKFTKPEIEIPQNPPTDNPATENPTAENTPLENPNRSPFTIPNIIKLKNDSTPMIILAGLSIIGIVSITTYKIIDKRNQKLLKKNKLEQQRQEDTQRIERENRRKIEEEERLEKFQNDEKKRREKEAQLEQKQRQEFEEAQKRMQIEDERARLEEEEHKLNEIENEKILQDKINRHEGLYAPDDVEPLKEFVSIRVFYDLGKKDSKYWKETGLLDRIHFKEAEIRDELKIKQNKITLKISVEKGDKHKYAKLISGGTRDFWDHNSEGYSLQAHISKPEEFLKLLMIKHMRSSYPDMHIHESTHSITAILLRENADYDDASNVLKRITQHFCDELSGMGDVLIEK